MIPKKIQTAHIHWSPFIVTRNFQNIDLKRGKGLCMISSAFSCIAYFMLFFQGNCRAYNLLPQLCGHQSAKALHGVSWSHCWDSVTGQLLLFFPLFPLPRLPWMLIPYRVYFPNLLSSQQYMKKYFRQNTIIIFKTTYWNSILNFA